MPGLIEAIGEDFLECLQLGGDLLNHVRRPSRSSAQLSGSNRLQTKRNELAEKVVTRYTQTHRVMHLLQ